MGIWIEKVKSGRLIPIQVSHSALLWGLQFKGLAVDFVLTKPLEPGLPWSRFWESSNPWPVTNTKEIHGAKDLSAKDLTKQKKNPKKTPQDSLSVHGGLQLISGSESGRMRAGLASAGARGSSRVTIAQRWRLLPTMGNCWGACLAVSSGLLL